MLFTIFTNVITLTIGFNSSTKRIVRIFFNRFHNLFFWCTTWFVRIKPNVYTIRKIISIDSHAFQIVCTINKNTNLCIVRVAKIKIFNTSTKFDNAIFSGAALITILNHDSFAVDASRILSFLEREPTIFRMIISQRSNLFSMVISILLIKSIFSNNGRNSLLLRIGSLLKTNTVNLVTFSLKNEQSFFQGAIGNTKFFLNTSANIDHVFCFKLFSDRLSSNVRSVLVLCSVLIQERTNR